MQRIKTRSIVQALALFVAVIMTGAATVVLLNQDIPDFAVPAGAWSPGQALDGKVFHTTDTIIESGDVINDELHFVDGRFQSAMCQIYCDFGWSPYQTWTDGDVIHFTATTRCPDAPHTVVYYGTIEDGNLNFQGTWTTRRWYWTHQVNFIGEGNTTPIPGAVAGS